MSTRAIIGMKNADGTILGAWQWSDGDGLEGLLNKNFSTPESAMQLIHEGMWDTIFSEAEKDEYEEWLVSRLYRGREEEIPGRKYVCMQGVYLLIHPHHENRYPKIYSDYEHAVGEDIHDIYLFDVSESRWIANHDI